MKTILLIFLLPFAILAQDQFGTIKGSVKDEETGDPIVSANVWLDNTNIGSTTDLQGNYIIKNAPFGSHKLKCGALAHNTRMDSVKLDDVNNNVVVNFVLPIGLARLIIPDSLKQYHAEIARLKSEDLMKIVIDSISADYSSLYLKFINKSSYPIYLLDNLHCFKSIDLFLTNENGEVFHGTVPIMDCDLCCELPKKKDLITLPPFSSLSYPAVKVGYYFDFGLHPLPKGKYFVNVQYEMRDLKYLPLGAVPGPNNLYVLSKATRGIFKAENRIAIER